MDYLTHKYTEVCIFHIVCNCILRDLLETSLEKINLYDTMNYTSEGDRTT